MGYKGSWARPRSVSLEEKDLRYELAFKCKPNSKRAKEIEKRIKELEDGRNTPKD